MMRCALSSAPTALTAAFAEQRRTMKMSTLNETMKPIPGQTAGTLNVMNEISVNPDADEERKRPAWRREVYPKQSEHSYLATMYKWGYNSLSLFKKVNEDPGQWWNANSSTLTSNWAQIGDYAAAGMWSGVWRFTYGLGQYNLTPCQARQNAYGRKDKNGALTIDYKESLTAVENYVSPHLPEHQKHRRFKNPELPGFSTMEQVKTKRTEREVQYHLGQGLRMYLVDGFFGSHPSTSTSFRVITDNADHAYAITMYANRQNNIHSFREMPLLKRVGTSPMDEWSWRRPGVVLLHAPGYSFEAPRIVEEFGGPRPQDLGLVTPKFRLVDPYSIPMKAYLGAVPETSAVIDTLGFLCSRWAFYADDKEHLTLIGDSVASADGQSVTIVVDATGKADTTALRRSPFVYGSRHHRLADGLFTRGWDAVSQPLAENKTHELDFVETSLNVLHRPLSTVINAPAGVNAFSHRFYNKRRSIANFGFKRSHNHTADPTQRAASAGMLFNAPKSNIVRRPAAFHASAVKVVVIEEKGGAAKPLDNKAASEAVVASLEATGLLYAEADKLAAAFAIALSHTAGATSVGPNEAKALIAKLSQSGTA